MDLTSIRAAAPTYRAQSVETALVPTEQDLVPIRAFGRAAERHHDHVGQIAAWQAEANLDLRLNRMEAARNVLVRIVSAQEQWHGRDAPEVANALFQLGWFHSNLAEYGAAQDCFDRCRALRQRRSGPGSAPVGEVANALGVLEENRGNFALARLFYEEALEICRRAGPEGALPLATALNNLGTLEWITGDYAEAARWGAEALALREQTLGADSVVVATSLHNLALLETSLGDTEVARAHFRRAWEIRDRRLGPAHPLTITTLSELAQLDVRRGDDAAAEPLLRRTLAQRRAANSGDHPDIARALEQVALLDDRRGAWAEAGRLHREALAMGQRVLGPGQAEVGTVWAGLARHEHLQKRGGSAQANYEAALQIERDQLGDAHPTTIETARDLAFLALDRGDRAAARALIPGVVAAQEQALNSVLAFTPERQRLGYEKGQSTLDLPAALNDPELLAQTLFQTKGVVLDSLLEDRSPPGGEAETERLLAERRRLATAAPPTPGARPEAAGQRRAEIERELSERSLPGETLRRALRVSVAEVRAALPTGAALIEYFTYRRYTGWLRSEPAWGALVLAAGNAPRWIDLGSQADGEADLRLYQKYMRVRVRDVTLARLLHRLHQRWLDPVLPLLSPGTRRLIISPDEELNFVSFATLLDGHNRFALENQAIDYVSSGRDLLIPPSQPERSRGLAIFAAPDYASPSSAFGVKARAGEETFSSLPGTADEASQVAAIGRHAGFPVEVFLGATASKARLKSLHSPTVLHLATHGRFLNREVFPVGGRTDPVASMERSVLALAGANPTLTRWQRERRIDSRPDDGLLTAQDAAELDLAQTWLVVLSACDTGTGQAQAGEGVLGLRRGFAEAGARHLLVTLWPVDDRAAATLMSDFYRRALDRGDAPEALAVVQRAQLVALRAKEGLGNAVRTVGPFILSH